MNSALYRCNSLAVSGLRNARRPKWPMNWFRQDASLEETGWQGTTFPHWPLRKALRASFSAAALSLGRKADAHLRLILEPHNLPSAGRASPKGTHRIVVLTGVNGELAGLVRMRLNAKVQNRPRMRLQVPPKARLPSAARQMR
jgi:hypothetical protein